MIALFLVTLVESVRIKSSSQLGLEPAIPYSYTGYSCSLTSTEFILEVCKLCQADTVYVIEYPDSSYLEAYDQSTKDQAQAVLEDVEQYFPSAYYYAVAVTDSTCVSAYSFKEEANYTEVLGFFAGEEATSIYPPEIFDLSGSTSLEFMAVRSTEEEYDYFSMYYAALDSAEVTKSVVYNLKNLYIFFEDEGYVDYTGNAYIGMEEPQNFQFRISTSYYREFGDPFTSRILVNESYTLSDWVVKFNPYAACEKVTPPEGISSLENLLVTYATQSFIYESETLKISEENSYFECPDFALAPEVYFESIQGSYITYPEQSTCLYLLEGTWNFSSYEIALEVYNDESNKYYGSGNFRNVNNITVASIEKDFYLVLYPENNTLFPEFEPYEPKIVSNLKSGNISFPKIMLYFDPDLSFSIYGSNIEVITGRCEGVLQRVVHSLNQEPQEEVYLSYKSLKVSSEDLDLESCYKMQSLLSPGIQEWTQGVTLTLSIEIADECQNSFCQLLKDNSAGDSIELSGYVIGDNIQVSEDFKNFEIAEGTYFEESVLSAEITERGFEIVVKGSVYLKVDEHTELRFVGKVYEGRSGEAILETVSDSVWVNAMDIQRLHVVGLNLVGKLDLEGYLEDYHSYGIGLIGNVCSNATDVNLSCVNGTIDMYLSFQDYNFNYFVLSFANLTNTEFYNEVLGFSFKELPLEMDCLKFPAGVYLHYLYGEGVFTLDGNVEFCGVPGDLDGKLSGLQSSFLAVNVTLTEFYFGNNNLRMNQGKALLGVSSGVSEAFIEGVINVWGIETTERIYIEEEFYLSVAGVMYGSDYEVLLEFKAKPDLDLVNSEFECSVTISEFNLKAHEVTLQTQLKNWVESGTKVLENSEKILSEMTQDLGVLKSAQCKGPCPETPKCSSSQQQCISQNYNQTCLEGVGCSNVQLTCSEYEVVCVKEVEGDCMSTVQVCKEWTSECTEESTQCATKQIQPSSCEEFVDVCKYTHEPDLKCTSECEWNQLLLDLGLQEYQKYKNSNNLTQTDLEGFKEINELFKVDFSNEKIAKLYEVHGFRSLNESGISPRDFKYFVQAEVLSLESMEFVPVKYRVNWNVFQDQINQNNLFEVVKAQVINLSQGAFSSDLVNKSAYEVVQENLYFNTT